MKQGDIILFNKSEGSLVGEYKYGIVEEVHRSPDGKIRSVKIKYRNANENVDRITVRAVRTLIVIHRVHEIDIMEEIGKSAIYVSSYYTSFTRSFHLCPGSVAWGVFEYFIMKTPCSISLRFWEPWGVLNSVVWEPYGVLDLVGWVNFDLDS